MAQFPKTFIQNLKEDVKIRQLGTIVFNADNLSNVINVELYDGDTPATLSGTVVGAVICPDGSTVPIDNGSISGNVVTMTLTAACFAIIGQIGVGIQIVSGDVKTTIFKGIYNVDRFETDNVIDPDSRITMSVSDLIDDIATAVASIPADYSDLMAAIAPTFDSNTAYAAGAYVWYDGILYQFTTAHAAGTWDASQVVTGNLASGIEEQKEIIDAQKEISEATAIIVQTDAAPVAHFTDAAALNTDVIVNIVPTQSGSGEPSPTNVRPISGHTGATITVSDTDSGGTETSVSFPAGAGTVYGGTLTIYRNGSAQLIVDRVIETLDDSNDWTEFASGKYFTNVAEKAVYGAAVRNKYISNQYPFAGNGDTSSVNISSDKHFYGQATTTLKRIWVYNSDYATVDAFKTALSVTPLVVVYPIATPVTYNFTASQIALFAGENYVHSNVGDCSVNYIANIKLYIDQKISALSE